MSMKQVLNKKIQIFNKHVIAADKTYAIIGNSPKLKKSEIAAGQI